MNSSEQQQRQEDPPRERIEGLRLSEKIEHQLRSIAEDKGISVQQLVEEGIGLVLQKYGRPVRTSAQTAEEIVQSQLDRDRNQLQR